MAELKPFYENVQSHYDLSDEFFALFLDASRTYSCAYFESDAMSLEEAQLAKIKLSLKKCELAAGQRLLDVGCGWGTTALRAAEDYRVNVIGLTLSQHQYAHASRRAMDRAEGAGSVDFRLMGWEEFDEPVDRIVSIGAFEHFCKVRHRAFFERCRQILPDDGQMMLHTIVLSSDSVRQKLGLLTTEEDVVFAKFIRREIFPGGELCTPERIESLASQAGFDTFHVEELRLHYARTLDLWAQRLEAAEAEAVEITSQEVFERYMKYLTGCALQFRKGNIDVMQFCMRCR